MRYKPERALTLGLKPRVCKAARRVEMRYKPERALTPASDFWFLMIAVA